MLIRILSMVVGFFIHSFNFREISTRFAFLYANKHIASMEKRIHRCACVFAHV